MVAAIASKAGGLIDEIAHLIVVNDQVQAAAEMWAASHFTPDQKEEVLVKIAEDGKPLRDIKMQVHGANA